MVGEPGEIPQQPTPEPSMPKPSGPEMGAQEGLSRIGQKTETAFWTDEDVSRFTKRLVELGIINEGGPKPTEHVVPDNAPAPVNTESFLRSHGAGQYVDSLQGLPPEEKNWRMHKLYTGAYSEEVREKFEKSTNAGQPPSTPNSQ